MSNTDADRCKETRLEIKNGSEKHKVFMWTCEALLGQLFEANVGLTFQYTKPHILDCRNHV